MVKTQFTINKGYCRRSYTSFIFKPICRVTLHAGSFSPHRSHQRNHQSSTAPPASGPVVPGAAVGSAGAVVLEQQQMSQYLQGPQYPRGTGLQGLLNHQQVQCPVQCPTCAGPGKGNGISSEPTANLQLLNLKQKKQSLLPLLNQQQHLALYCPC